MLTFAGLPLFFLELAIGQYGGLGPNKLFGRLAPLFKGLGYGMLFVTFLVAIYYNMIIAWTLFYTFAGFQSQLPWEFCGNEWNTLTCYTKPMAENCSEVVEDSTYWNNDCTRVEDVCKHYNKTWAPDTLDRFNVTECAWPNGTAVPLEEVSLNSVQQSMKDHFKKLSHILIDRPLYLY